MDNDQYFILAAFDFNSLVLSNKTYSLPYSATYNIQVLSTVWSIDTMSTNFEFSYPISKQSLCFLYIR